MYDRQEFVQLQGPHTWLFAALLCRVHNTSIVVVKWESRVGLSAKVSSCNFPPGVLHKELVVLFRN
jgi:hypothetical protein